MTTNAENAPGVTPQVAETDYAGLDLSDATVAAIQAHAALVTVLLGRYGHDAARSLVVDAATEMLNGPDRDESVSGAGWWVGLAHRLRRIAGERGLTVEGV